MSIVIFHKGKLYADSQATFETDGILLKFYNHTKATIIGGYKIAGTGTKSEFDYFVAINNTRSYIKKGLLHLTRFFTITKSDMGSTLYRYDIKTGVFKSYVPRFLGLGWKTEFKIRSHDKHWSIMGSGSEYYGKDMIGRMVGGRIDPVTLIEYSIERDEYSGGRVVIV